MNKELLLYIVLGILALAALCVAAFQPPPINWLVLISLGITSALAFSKAYFMVSDPSFYKYTK